jgi:hypothetical protein
VNNLRNISFALTTPQFYRREKTVTRRLGWVDLRPGQLLCGVEKGHWLKPGEELKRLAIIRVDDVRREKLSAITDDDVRREGFAEMSRREFVRMFCDSHETAKPSSLITRIQYRYLPGGRFDAVGLCRLCGVSDQELKQRADEFDRKYRGLWADDRGLLTTIPTTVCSSCWFGDRFAG